MTTPIELFLNLTSNSNEHYTVSSNQDVNNILFKAFDGEANTNGWSTLNSDNPLSASFDLKFEKPINLTGFNVYCDSTSGQNSTIRNRNFKSMNVYTSDDGVSFTLLKSFTTDNWSGTPSFEKRTFDFDEPVSAKYLRFGEIAPRGSDYLRIGEMSFNVKPIENKTLILHDGEYKRWNEKIENPLIDIDSKRVVVYTASEGLLPSSFGWNTYSANTISSVLNGVLTIKDNSNTLNSGWYTPPNIIDNSLINIIEFECRFQTPSSYVYVSNGEKAISLAHNVNTKILEPNVILENIESSSNFVKFRIIAYKKEKFIIYANNEYKATIIPTISDSSSGISIMGGDVSVTNQIIDLKNVDIAKFTEEEYLDAIKYYKTNNNKWSVKNSEDIQTEGMDSLSSLLDRKLTTLEPIPLVNETSVLLSDGEEGKIFSQTINLKKYLDIRNMKVEVE